MFEPERFEFNTFDGLALRGDFYQAKGENRPIAVMTAGLALLRHFADPFARALRDGGVSSILFDYRSYGSSEGVPRHDTDLLQQAEDYRDGVTAAMGMPGVDPTKVIVWGVGHGGAAALIAAADDPRPKAVILMAPIVSGRVDSKAFPKGALERSWRDREAKTRAGETEPTYLQAWPESLEQARGEGKPVLFQFEAAFGFINPMLERAKAADTPWENRITLRSLQNIASVEPKDWLHKIEQPTLYVVPPADPFTGTQDYQREAFGRMGKNGEFKVFTPAADGGFEGFVTAAVDPQLEFLNRVLR